MSSGCRSHPLAGLWEAMSSWHIAFRCAAEFGRYRGTADIDQNAPIKFDL